MASNDLSPRTSSAPAVKGAVVVGAAIVALILAKVIFSFVLTLVKSVLFLAILAGVVWFGYRLISGTDDSTT